MKLVCAIAGLALIGGVAALPAAPASAARASEHGKWCLMTGTSFAKQNCGYSSKQRCEKFARPQQGTCKLNPKWHAARHMKRR